LPTYSFLFISLLSRRGTRLLTGKAFPVYRGDERPNPYVRASAQPGFCATYGCHKRRRF
jgi:hypothetical protein